MPHSSGPEKRFENVLASRRVRKKWAVKYDYCQGKSDVQAIADYEAIPSGPYPLDPLTERFVVQQQGRIKSRLHARIITGILREIIIVRIRVY